MSAGSVPAAPAAALALGEPRAGPSSGWRIDYHVHTASSFDSTAAAREVVARAVAAGLDAICITDHDTIEGGMQAMRIAPPGLQVIIGCEVSLRDGGQVLGIGLARDVVGHDLDEVSADIHAQGGLVLMPHPFRRGSGLLRPELRRTEAAVDRILSLIDLVEAHNGRDTWENNARSRRLVVERGLAGVAGSDAHRVEEVGRTFVEYKVQPDRHGRGARTLWHVTQHERRESPLKRRLLEWYHAHERAMPGVVRSGYRAVWQRAHADGRATTGTPPTAQLSLDDR